MRSQALCGTCNSTKEKSNMKKRGLLVLSISIGIALLLGACGPDRQLGYQAVLTGPGGIPVANGDYTVKVEFWDALTAGTSIPGDPPSGRTVVAPCSPDRPSWRGAGPSPDRTDFAQPLW